MAADLSQPDSAPVNGGFVFINKTSTSLTNTTAEVWAVASHASKTHRRQHKKRTGRPSSGARGKPILPRPILSSDSAVLASKTGTVDAQCHRARERPGVSSYLQINANVVAGDDVSRRRRRRIENLEDRLKVPSHTAFHLRKGQAEPDKRQQNQVRHATLPMLWKGDFDPFAATAIPLSFSEHEVLHFARQFYVFVAKPSDKNAVWRSRISDFRSS
jgi:hypothetical protein